MATDEQMKLLKQAIADGKRVEIDQYPEGSSPDFRTASKSGKDASERNARGERVARIRNADGGVSRECGISQEQSFELLDAGAVPQHPGDQPTT